MRDGTGEMILVFIFVIVFTYFMSRFYDVLWGMFFRFFMRRTNKEYRKALERIIRKQNEYVEKSNDINR